VKADTYLNLQTHMHCTVILRSEEDGFFNTKWIGRLCWSVFLADCIIDKIDLYSFFLDELLSIAAAQQ
jgi:hypothetical protein